MPDITLTEEQARTFAESPPDMIELRDPQGKVLASVQSPALRAILDLIKRRRESGERGVPSHKVQDMLRQLHEAERNGMDDAGLRALADRILEEHRH
jgi:hypothetical protein